jgi:Flp pilus assembly pilin Flp
MRNVISKVQDSALKLYVQTKTLLSDERGQDLVEYGMVLVLVVLGATAGMGTLASGINNAMLRISSKLAAYTS